MIDLFQSHQRNDLHMNMTLGLRSCIDPVCNGSQDVGEKYGGYKIVQYVACSSHAIPSQAGPAG